MFQDKTLELLADSVDLEMLALGESNITDSGIHSLQRLRCPEFVDLGQVKIGENAVHWLGTQKHLKYLTLRRAQITPSATNSMFQSLANIQLLELLDLGDVAIPASGFEWIAHQPNLNRLKLNGASPSIGTYRSWRGYPNSSIWIYPTRSSKKMPQRQSASCKACSTWISPVPRLTMLVWMQFPASRILKF